MGVFYMAIQGLAFFRDLLAENQKIIKIQENLQILKMNVMNTNKVLHSEHSY